jgi:hypothetical protein
VTTPQTRLHQQYLAKNPFGYRCHANTGVRFPETDWLHVPTDVGRTDASHAVVTSSARGSRLT